MCHLKCVCLLTSSFNETCQAITHIVVLHWNIWTQIQFEFVVILWSWCGRCCCGRRRWRRRWCRCRWHSRQRTRSCRWRRRRVFATKMANYQQRAFLFEWYHFRFGNLSLSASKLFDATSIWLPPAGRYSPIRGGGGASPSLFRVK